MTGLTLILFSFLLPLPRVRFPRLGLQARIEPRIQTDPAVALHFGAAAEGGVSGCDRLAGGLWRVCHQGSRRGGSTVGDKEMQTSHEL